jgi:hypothetical protein
VLEGDKCCRQLVRQRGERERLQTHGKGDFLKATFVSVSLAPLTKLMPIHPHVAKGP